MNPGLPFAVAGAARLVGRGVYVDLPAEPLPIPGRDGIVVSGDLIEAATAVLRVRPPDARVMVVTREAGRTSPLPPSLRRQLQTGRDVTIHYSTAVVWAVGVDYLEAVVLRHLPSGRIIVRNASALVMVSPAGQARRHDTTEPA